MKPLLFPNDPYSIDDVQDGPKIASRKLDGIKLLFLPEGIRTRSMKQVPNKRLREKFDTIIKYCKENNIILDGEVYSHDLKFQEITGCVMSYDKEVPESLKFYCFDAVVDGYFNMPFEWRLNHIPELEGLEKVEQRLMWTRKEVKDFFEKALEEGYEGLIIRHPDSPYKQGRFTLKQEMGFKLKPYSTYDARIKGIVQATKVNPDADKKTNELGYSETSRKKGDRVPVEMVSAFVVDWDGVEQKVTYAATDEQKKWAWDNQEQLIGKMIEFKAMEVGSKDRLRHPVFIRFREDKE